VRDDFLSRWSRRKIQARQGEVQAPLPEEAQAVQGDGLPVATQPPAPPAPLPPIESLTSESDYSVFMRPDVDPGTRRLAMKKLFEDPRYNVMDGLDTYIADYSLPDPLPEGWLEKMNQVARLGIFKPAPEPEVAEAAPAEGVPAAGLPAPDAAPATPLPSVTSGEGTDALPVPKSPSAAG
jgi:hypothetical protein